MGNSTAHGTDCARRGPRVTVSTVPNKQKLPDAGASGENLGKTARFTRQDGPGLAGSWRASGPPQTLFYSLAWVSDSTA